MNAISRRFVLECLCSNRLRPYFRCQNGSFAEPNIFFYSIWTLNVHLEFPRMAVCFVDVPNYFVLKFQLSKSSSTVSIVLEPWWIALEKSFLDLPPNALQPIFRRLIGDVFTKKSSTNWNQLNVCNTPNYGESTSIQSLQQIKLMNFTGLNAPNI